MRKITRQQIRALIELSTTFEEADKVIEEYAEFKTVEEKIAYIKGMFDVEIIDPHPTPLEDAYKIMLDAIINMKWKA